MHFTRFRQLSLNVTLYQWRNRVKYIVLYVLSKHATKPRALGLLGHSVLVVGEGSNPTRKTDLRR